MVCLRSEREKLANDPGKPAFLVICRSSQSGDVNIYGKLKIFAGSKNKTMNTFKENPKSLHEKKFIKLIYNNQCVTNIDLEFKIPIFMKDIPLSYVIRGVIIIFKDCEYPFQDAKTQTTVFEKAGASALKSLDNIDNTKKLSALKNLSEDFMQLFDEVSSPFTDVVLKCGSLSIPVHKCILSARSPVFYAMFKNTMREDREKTVDIVDIDISVLRIMLVYIYTGKTGGITVSNVHDLLSAADKYQLTGMKKMCSEYMKHNTEVQNILNILMIGYLHDQDLKEFAMNFICNKIQDFSVLENTKQWKRLCTEMPALAIEVSVSFIKAKDGKWKKIE
ncbi:TD and POZ domain-containing protein 3 [Nephila pilipes]|uniref:TD and POZ domain-containing protein 3 n=1 Tax=Nephila pilipes TaxID=299642 RepID=A0A8X6PCG2_NEPPI|nr:TD and POZ domain-containing protein 3 [Nephila pilipes]